MHQLNEHAKLSMLRNASWTLSNFCKGKPQPVFEQTRPALPAFERLIHSNDEEVLTYACWALSYLSDGTNDKIQVVIEAGVCPRLVELLLHPSPSVLIPTLRTVGNIVTRDDMRTQAETPIDTYKDDNDKHRTWYFPAHDFTLMVIWTEFLVESAEIIVNGTPSNTFSINLDRMNPIWAHKLPELQYAVINHGNWFTRRTYIHKRGKLMGCVHCYKEKIPSISVTSAIRMVFRAAFDHINKCKQCDDLLTIMRTYSMSHFEHGSWFTGGYCNRTRPLSEGDLRPDHEAWEFRKIQMEEMWRAKGQGKRRIELMDVTFSMMLRADAHPGTHWVAKVTSDCLHWCLPGPVDMWNELLLEILKKNT